AGAKIEGCEWRVLVWEPAQSGLDQGFRFGARDQYAVINGEGETPELAPTCDVGNRFVLEAPVEQYGKSPLRFRIESHAAGGQGFLRGRECMGEQKSCFQTRRFDTRLTQLRGRASECRFQSPLTSAFSAKGGKGDGIRTHASISSAASREA